LHIRDAPSEHRPEGVTSIRTPGSGGYISRRMRKNRESAKGGEQINEKKMATVIKMTKRVTLR